MKVLLTIITLLLLGLNSVKSQSYYKKQWIKQNTSGINVGITSMRSVRGWERGFDLTYVTAKKFQVGIFSYKSNGTSEVAGNNYQGIIASLPLLKIEESLRLGMSARLGLHNKRFISFLPMLKLAYDLNKKMSFVTSAGVSDRLPVFAFKLNLRLNRRIK